MNTGLKAEPESRGRGTEMARGKPEPESRGRGTEMAKGKLEATPEVRKL